MDNDELRQRIEAEISRRRILKLMGLGLLVGPVIAACNAVGVSPSTVLGTPSPTAGGGASPSASGGASPSASTFSDKGPIVINVQTGDLAKAEVDLWLTPFSAKTGIAVTPDERAALLDLLTAQVQAGAVQVDVFTATPSGLPRDKWAAYFEPIDWSIVDKEKLEPGSFNDYLVGSSLYSQVLAWNTKALGEGKTPTGWVDLLDLNKFPGKRSIENAWDTAAEIGLLMDGVPVDKLFPLDVERGLAKLNPIKDKIVWYDTGSQVYDLMTSGEVALGSIYNGRASTAVANGFPIKVTWNQQILDNDFATVSKGTKHKEAAMRFIAFLASQDGMAITKKYAYPPPVKGGIADPANAEWVASQHFDQPYFFIDHFWIDDNTAKYDPIFKAWKTS